ncbi:MAG: Hsp20 family protein [Candidatus Sulfotelmatobacter sp.]
MKSTKMSALTAEPPTTLLQSQDPEKLRWEMQPVQLAIARRAFELFEKRGREHGHDWEDWFRAESEFLCPVSIATSESDERLSIRANVFGFAEKELQVSVEPRRVAILGKREATTFQIEEGLIERVDWCPDRVLRLIDLPTEVDPQGAVIELQEGMLKVELPKAATRHKRTPAAA